MRKTSAELPRFRIQTDYSVNWSKWHLTKDHVIVMEFSGRKGRLTFYSRQDSTKTNTSAIRSNVIWLHCDLNFIEPSFFGILDLILESKTFRSEITMQTLYLFSYKHLFIDKFWFIRYFTHYFSYSSKDFYAVYWFDRGGAGTSFVTRRKVLLDTVNRNIHVCNK